jgi:tryptophan synthase alpha chain
MKCAKKSGLDTICFLSPTSSKERMQSITKVATGFIYYVSLTGVTGARAKLPPDLAENIKLIRKYTRKPVCVGFGVSNTAQIKQIYKIADGAIVGSAIVKIIKDNIGKPDLIKRVGNFTRSLII